MIIIVILKIINPYLMLSLKWQSTPIGIELHTSIQFDTYLPILLNEFRGDVKFDTVT